MVQFASLVAVLFRVELIDLFGVICRWCAVKGSEVLSTKRSTVTESPDALGVIEPHGQGADMQWVLAVSSGGAGARGYGWGGQCFIFPGTWGSG